MLRLTRRNRSSTPIVPHTSSLRLRCFAADSGVNFSDATFISWAWSKHQNFPKIEPFVGISMGRYGEPFLWFPIWIPKWRSWWVKHDTKRCGLHQQKVSSPRFNQPTLVEGTNIVCSSLMKSYEYTSQSLMDRYGSNFWKHQAVLRITSAPQKIQSIWGPLKPDYWRSWEGVQISQPISQPMILHRLYQPKGDVFQDWSCACVSVLYSK